jgi:hypothetical protein
MVLHNVVQSIFLLAGAISLLASLLNWDWFFTADNVQFLVKRIGRNGTRWAYGIIGIVFISAAVYFFYQVEATVRQ